MTDKTKHHLFSYLFIVLAILLMFLIMILVVYFTRNSGTKTVKNLLQEKLEFVYPEQFSVANSKNINLPLNSSSYAFDVLINNSKEVSNLGTVIAVRITSSYGPVVGVFFKNPFNNEVEYLGVLDFNNHIEKYSWNKIPNSQIKYWTTNLNNILMEEE
jgi:hypothetical protein